MHEIMMWMCLGMLALICEYIDSALGGGYGTILVPLLLLFGFDSLLVVPAVLFTEFWTGLLSGLFHHRVGNASFTIRRYCHDFGNKLTMSEDFQIAALLGLCGILGGIIAAFAAINLPTRITKTYIGILVAGMGVLVIANIKWKFSWAKITGIGLLAAFNKGISGGGYGPLISSGQIIVDRNPKQAVASTSLSEAFVCGAALLIYLIQGEFLLNVPFLIALMAGCLGSIPFAVYTVKHLQIQKFQPLIGLTTILLGIITLLKTWVF